MKHIGNEQSGREREKPEKEKRKKNILPKRENIQPFENEEESNWKETYARSREIEKYGEMREMGKMDERSQSEIHTNSIAKWQTE